jgi:hypothetical protein
MAVKLHRRGVELDALLRTAPNHRKQGRNLPRWLDGNRYRYGDDLIPETGSVLPW